MRVYLSIALVVVTLMAALTSSCAATTAPTAPLATSGGVRFVLMDPGARSVSLAGSFNEWSTSSHPLAQGTSPGSWTIVVPLPPGEHVFMYVVNGTEWISPPFAEGYVDDGFGSKNGIVVVRPRRR